MFDAYLRITHVYKGPPDLKEQAFKVSASKSGQGSYGFAFSPPLNRGETGIWLVKLEVNSGIIPDLTMGRLNVRLPSRQEEPNSRYSQAKAWAESVELATKTAPEDRLDLLKKLSLNEISEISAWAIGVIAETNSAETTAFFNDLLSNYELSVGAQIALDNALSNMEGSNWQTSEKRFDLLKRWAGGKYTEYDASQIASRFSAVVKSGTVDDLALLNLLKANINNYDMPITVRQNAVRLIGVISQRARDEGMAFQALTEIVKDAKEEDLKIVAAHTINNFVPLVGDRFSIIQGLKAQAANKKVADALEEALKHPKNQ